MANNDFDAIVIGTGISGGWAAKDLCKGALKTLVLERGRNIEHIKDYKTANVDGYEMPFRGKLSTEELEKHSSKLELVFIQILVLFHDFFAIFIVFVLFGGTFPNIMPF
tara:strand:- start:109 stop:435 length:327 start_codon:yes stop_codon:yes gene_type:complete